MPATAEISHRAREQSERVRAWLRPFMENGKPKMATKEELWSVANRNLAVSRASFDLGWGLAIHDTGHEDWYEPMRKRLGKSRGSLV
jgi:hypothetical protein